MKRKPTDQERKYYKEIFKKEIERAKISEKINGMDNSHYIALHHRWDRDHVLR